jgi:diguanylate cyclase (GGDEF)-like protein
MGAPPEHPRYCELYGFDAAWRQAQLSLLDLGETDLPFVDPLHQRVLTPEAVAPLIQRFYDRLMGHEPARSILSSYDQARLQGLQERYLSTLAVAFNTEQYFEARLRVGVSHARVGVPLSLYLLAFSLLQQLILERVGQSDLSPEEGRGVAALVLKATALDVMLATEVYHLSEVRKLEGSMQHLRREQERLRQAVETDELTGLLSRATVLQLLDESLEVAKRKGQPLCLAMADLDHFKRINDEHGHLMGDQVLRGVASRVRSAIRDFDAAGRYGGEEFLLILENTSLHTAQQVAERVRRRVADGPVHLHELAVPITISQGLAEVGPQDTAESLLARADQALYQAKLSGRNCVAVG